MCVALCCRPHCRNAFLLFFFRFCFFFFTIRCSRNRSFFLVFVLISVPLFFCFRRRSHCVVFYCFIIFNFFFVLKIRMFFLLVSFCFYFNSLWALPRAHMQIYDRVYAHTQIHNHSYKDLHAHDHIHTNFLVHIHIRTNAHPCIHAHVWAFSFWFCCKFLLWILLCFILLIILRILV